MQSAQLSLTYIQSRANAWWHAGGQHGHQLQYEAGLAVWQLTYYPPAKEAMGAAGIVPGLVDTVRIATKEKVNPVHLAPDISRRICETSAQTVTQASIDYKCEEGHELYHSSCISCMGTLSTGLSPGQGVTLLDQDHLTSQMCAGPQSGAACAQSAAD